jgi:CPA2 family monovalent cation:H+ antiporter-2
VHDTSVVQDLVLLYALALVFLLAGSRFRAPVIVSLIATGIVAGPGGLGLVQSEETVVILSEIGVALLLFVVGLDLSFGELRRLWRSVAIGGGAQVAGTVVAVAPIAWLLMGARADAVVFAGIFVAMSSTSLIIRELTRRNELHAPHGSLSVGILLLQDIVALMALVLLPAVFGTAGAPGLGLAVLQIAVIAGALVAVTRFLFPVLFRLSTASGREAFGLMVLVASLGTAWLASMLGLSMTVGAFLAGLAIDESEFSHQIHAEIRPLRDLLTSLFFISVGLLLDPQAIVPLLPAVIGVAAGIVLLKAVGTSLVLRLARVPPRVAGATGMALAQVGEFSLVLGKTAADSGIIGARDWQVLIGATVVTMMVTPALVSAAPRFGEWLARRSRDRTRAGTDVAAHAHLSGHVVILGFGIGGRLIAATLREIQTPHVILELNGAAVQQAMAEGHHILYADATAAEPLRAAGVASAAAVVAVLSDPFATERAARVVRSINPRVPLIVRTRYRLEASRMMQAGASLAVAEELEASLEVLAQMLVRLDVPGNVAEVLVSGARRVAGAEGSPRGVTAPAAPSPSFSGSIAQTPLAAYQLQPDDWGVGRSLGEVHLRAETGATVLAVKRQETTLAGPPPDWVFAAADILYMVGEETDVQLARSRLRDGPRRAGG